MKRYDFIPGCITFVEGRDYPIPGAESEDGLFVLYDGAMAEIDVTQTALRLMNKTAEIMNKEIDALKAELAALKAPPKVLSAEEVTEPGWYWWRGEYKEWEPVRVDIDEFGVDVWRIMTEIPAYDGEWGKPYGEFIGPLKATEVTNT